MPRSWPKPVAPEDIDVVYTANHGRTGCWDWTRMGVDPGETPAQAFWMCRNSAIGYRNWGELLWFYGPAYESKAELQAVLMEERDAVSKETGS